MNQNQFEDFYEDLQLSPNADLETIERVYRILAKRYHPDNLDTGDVEKFSQISRAYAVLSDPEKRAGYDVKYDEIRTLSWQIFDQSSATSSFEEDKRIFQGILTLLYISRRQNADNAGMGIVELEHLLGCPQEHLEFHVWYLREKGWLVRLESGKLAISSEGVDKVVEGEMVLRKDRLLGQGSDSGENGEDGEDGKRLPRPSLTGGIQENRRVQEPHRDPF